MAKRQSIYTKTFSHSNPTPSATRVVKVNLAFADVSQRTVANAGWTALFPDADNRPVRHSTQAVFDRGKLVQCDLVAWME